MIVDKAEFLHTAFNLVPDFSIQTVQWPHYDPVVYQSILWDREFSINASLRFDFKLEIAHGLYYRLEGTLDLFKIGFGFQEILFEQVPTHYCGLFYLDGRLLETTLALETNHKPCQLKPTFLDKLGIHYDSRGAQKAEMESPKSSSHAQSDQKSVHVEQQSDADDWNGQRNDKSLGDIMTSLHKWCHFDKEYEEKYFMRHELYHKTSWLPTQISDKLFSKEVFTPPTPPRLVHISTSGL